MEHIELKKNLYWIGIEDFESTRFDIIMETKYGTSYNSYLLKGSEKVAVFETEKSKHFDEYLSKLEEVCAIDQIDYIIMNHTEPDHADGIGILLEKNPNITVVGTKMAMDFLKQITNREHFNHMIVKDRDTLSLGDLTLEFHVLPNLHWPDTMWTYCKEIKTLFPCDSFGSHFATNHHLRSKVENEEGYWYAVRYYFDGVLGPYKQPFMARGLERFATLDVDMICTGHGPVLDSHIDELVEKYHEWCKIERPDHPFVVVPYVSAYGYTKFMAEEITKVLQENQIEVHLYDMVESDLDKVVSEINVADGFLLGSPTLIADALPPIWDVVSRLESPIVKGKYAAAFGSYGWTGEAVPNLTERLKQLRLKVQDGFRIRFKPSEKEVEELRAFAQNFAKLVKGE